MTKEQFLSEQFVKELEKLNGNENGQWGVLSPQGMIEHMTYSVGIAYGRIKEPLHTPPELVERSKAFAMSDKEFKPNTKNALMPDEPLPLVNNSISEARKELQEEINTFIAFYKEQPDALIQNPFFGELNYNEWLHLLEKHARHHLKQFNLL